jgi:hypothetical protein
MRTDATLKLMLFVIAVLLGIIALRPFFTVEPVHAQGSEMYPFYIEPGYLTLRAPDGSQQVTGKMVVDMRTGAIWGFPTYNASPYPIDSTRTVPPVSAPIYLGKFDFKRVQ